MKLLDFYDAVYAAVKEIPRGKVASYGQIAHLLGHPRGARMVGKAMSHGPSGKGIPYHRVVTKDGRLAPGFTEQKLLLMEEGVLFLPNGKVDMKSCLWK